MSEFFEALFWGVLSWVGCIILIGFLAKINYYIFMWGWSFV